MLKIWIIGGIILAVVFSGLTYYRFFGPQVSRVSQIKSPLEKGTLITGGSSQPIDTRVTTLELAVSNLIGQVKGVAPAESTLSSNLNERVKTIESTLVSVQQRLSALERSNANPAQTSSVQTTASQSKSPLYIPLNYAASSTATDWTTISTGEVVIDPSKYEGYSSMQFEASIRVFQNGKAFARILNYTDGTAVLSSEISTTSTDYTLLSSSDFTLPSGSKSYRLQLKSLTGYSTDVQNARIKINF